MTISPDTKAYIALALSTFAGGFFTFLAPRLNGGVPPQTEWPSILLGAAVFGALAVWHRFAPSPTDQTPAKEKAVAIPNGFARVEAILSLAFVAAGVYVFAACTPAQTVAGVNLSECILSTSVADADRGMSAAQIVADVAAKCSTDAVTVITTLDHAERAADATRAARGHK